MMRSNSLLGSKQPRKCSSISDSVGFPEDLKWILCLIFSRGVSSAFSDNSWSLIFPDICRLLTDSSCARFVGMYSLISSGEVTVVVNCVLVAAGKLYCYHVHIRSCWGGA